jgi:predicted O-linked N-acetylglucosamine transferase (SPINDLY family)
MKVTARRPISSDWDPEEKANQSSGSTRERMFPEVTMESERSSTASIPEALAVGLQHRQAGRLQEAEAIYRQILQVAPEQPDALYFLGVLAQQAGQPTVAADYIHKAITRKPHVAEFHDALGESYRAQGKLADAIAHYQRALALKPDCAEAAYHLAVACQQQGRRAEALTQYQQVLTLRPPFPELHNNLGVALQELGKLDEAVAHLREALALQPGFAEAYYNLANVLKAQGRLEEAVTHYRQTVALKPGIVEAHINLANALREQDKREEALAHYRQALALKPNFAEVENQIMQEMQHLCEWAGLEDLVARQHALLRTTPPVKIPPFSLLTTPSSPAEQLLCAQNWTANCVAQVAHLRQELEFRFPRLAKPKLRLGYLSADFRQHPVAHLVAELFKLHDRLRFEVIAYSYGPDDGGPLRARIAMGCDQFVDLTVASLVDAARRINHDGVDILIDLMGHTQWARTEILALRPAPLQVSYMGYLGTMGADFIDYIITDRFVSPPEQAPSFVEKFAYLPDCFMINHPQGEMERRLPTRRECGLPETGFVFCCFNNSYKITPEVFTIWMRLLRHVPDSVLWLLEANTNMAANLRREAQDRGVNPNRLVFAHRVSLDTHLARLGLADLFLDTLPYNAGATAGNALWAGLPLLTCAGETFISRVAGSLLTAIRLPELVTNSLPEYEARALHLARHPAELAELRERLSKNRLTAPLFDSPRFTRHLETAYQLMWDQYLRGEAPKRIEVPNHTGPKEALTTHT